PNGVDCERFMPSTQMRTEARRTLGFAEGHFVVGTIGNIRPVKNIPFLLRAIAAMGRRHPSVRLVCVGGGPQLEEMQALAGSLGPAGVVRFTGAAKDVRPFLSAMDAFVLCSTSEGNPNVVLQAMATALPVVAATVGEVPHLIEHGQSGLTYTPGDEAAFLA